MLRTLLHRLGLHLPEHRHKLRVLASSASLPMEGNEREASLRYLWDMFGSAGFGGGNTTPGDWSDSVIPGREARSEAEVALPLNAPAVIESVKALADSEGVSDLVPPRERPGPWKTLAAMVHGVGSPIRQSGTVRAVIRSVSDLISAACSNADGKMRATPAGQVADRLFGRVEQAREALQALLRLRAVGDELDSWFPSEEEQNDKLEACSFRIHMFLRALEGLFAAPRALSPQMNETARRRSLFSDMSVERGQRFSRTESGEVGPKGV